MSKCSRHIATAGRKEKEGRKEVEKNERTKNPEPMCLHRNEKKVNEFLKISLEFYTFDNIFYFSKSAFGFSSIFFLALFLFPFD